MREISGRELHMTIHKNTFQDGNIFFKYTVNVSFSKQFPHIDLLFSTKISPELFVSKCPSPYEILFLENIPFSLIGKYLNSLFSAGFGIHQALTSARSDSDPEVGANEQAGGRCLYYWNTTSINPPFT